MKYLLIAILTLGYTTVSAQNQIVRRQGVKNGASKSTPKNTATSSSTSRRAMSSSRNKTSQPTEASYSYGMLTVNGVRYEMVKVNAGIFTMGATPEMQTPWDKEKPAHQVTLTNNYYIGKTEVTQSLWRAVMDNNPSSFKGDNKPVEHVSWNDCQTFISKLNVAPGKNFRLPTEAEWEFAARGGNNSHHYQYSGSNSLDDVAWFDNNSGKETHDVATKQPNELGLYDMSGNVWEWCSDWDGFYLSPPQTNPTGAPYSTSHICRGGSWFNIARSCRSSNRVFNPTGRGDDVGFRLVISE